MPTPVPFVKATACGNDFVIVLSEDLPGNAAEVGEITRRLCDRKFGVGADGVLRISFSRACPSAADDVRGRRPRMEVFNSDGSVAGMCGNGIRCVAAAELGGHLARLAGTKARGEGGTFANGTKGDETAVVVGDGDVVTVTRRAPADAEDGRETYVVAMPTPAFADITHCGEGARSEGAEIGLARFPVTRQEAESLGMVDVAWDDEGALREDPNALGRVVCATLEVGNPHVVVAVTRRDPRAEVSFAARAESCARDGCNVNFVVLGNPSSPSSSAAKATVDLRTVERGVGPTLACGSGSCCTAVASIAALALGGGNGQAFAGLSPDAMATVAFRDEAWRCSVALEKGQLEISWGGAQIDPVLRMCGPAEIVFSGTVDI